MIAKVLLVILVILLILVAWWVYSRPHFKPASSYPKAVDGVIQTIIPDPTGRYIWGLSAGGIRYYDDKTKTWSPSIGGSISAAVGPNAELWSVDANGQVNERIDTIPEAPMGKGWKVLGFPAKEIVIYPNSLSSVPELKSKGIKLIGQTADGKYWVYDPSTQQKVDTDNQDVISIFRQIHLWIIGYNAK
jgi:hypothetical protein